MSSHKTPQLTTEQASQMLENIFEICRLEPNTIPLETLEDYSNYRAERFTFKRAVLIVIMLAFLAVPFLFLAPEMTVANKTTSDTSPKYEIAVHSLMPIKSVTASIDGDNVPVYETDDRIYTIEPTISGTVIVTATTVNEQINTLSIDVKVKQTDSNPPQLVSNTTRDGNVYLYITDDKSGIDYSSVYGTDASGNRIEPITHNSHSGYVVFPYPESQTDVYISDKDGNTLQLVLNGN